MPLLYRRFDRAALDREYSPSLAAGGDIRRYLDRYAALSDIALGLPDFVAGIAYGSHPDEILDLLPPPGGGPRPLHIFIHGGYWQALSQRDFAFLGPAFQRRGVAFATLNHTLAPAASIAEMVTQCRRAVCWLRDNAGRFGLDPGHITLSGHSAGAHLCAMLLADPAIGALVKRSLLISGVYDLEPIRLSYVGEPLGLSAADVAALSPLRLDMRPPHPCAIVWGEYETAEFKRQSTEFAAILSEAGCAIRQAEFAGLNHFDILFEFLAEDSRLLAMAV